jgi:uncharacterized protein YndB with AHSA1/START domain
VQTTTDIKVEREITIAARPETVWEFLVDSTKATRWIGQTASFDPRPGGEYRVDVIPGHTASGVFVELDPPRRLVHTFGWEPGPDGPNPVPAGSTTIEIELVPTDEGTMLRFTHRDLPTAEAAESHLVGWDHYLERLAIAARGDEPGSDPWISDKPEM